MSVDKTLRTGRARALIAALATAALVMCALGVGSCVFTPKDNAPELGQIDASANGVMGEPADSLDVLFVGDSETSNTVIPAQLWHDYGFTSYDVASNGQTLPYSYTLLKRALKKQHPRVVVLEGNMLYATFSTSLAMLRMAGDYVPLLEYHDRWKSLTARDFTQLPQTTWTDAAKGHLSFKDVRASQAPDDHMASTSEVEVLPIRSKLYLQLLVDTIRAAGATPVIEAAPSLKSWSSRRHNEISRIAAEMGVDFIDYNEMLDQIGIDWSCDTRDGGDHLNNSGAQKTTSMIGKVMAEKFDLPDHRGDAAYSAWDGTYQAFQDSLS